MEDKPKNFEQNSEQQIITIYYNNNENEIFEINPIKYLFNSFIEIDRFGPLAIFESTKNKKLVIIEKITQAYKTKSQGKNVLKYLSLIYYLDHPNIITLKEIYIPNKINYENAYLIYQNEGTTLEDLINSKYNYFQNENLIPWIIYQILKGLFYLKNSGIIHRNIKPSNILLDENSKVKIGGFGHAICNDNYKIIIGNIHKKQSLSHQAPEILLNENYHEEKSDIWSLGCIMAELFDRTNNFFNKFKCSNSPYKNQLYGIFRKLNIYSDDEIKKFSSEKTNIILNNIKQAKLKDVFPNIKDNNAIDLLEKLFVIDPIKRISILEAKDHPYFDIIKNHKKNSDFIYDKKKFFFMCEKDIEEMQTKNMDDEFQINYYKDNIKMMNSKKGRKSNSQNQISDDISTMEQTK